VTWGPWAFSPRTRKFRIAAIFYSGMYEYDATHVYTTLDEAQSYFATPAQISAIEVKVDDAENADRLTLAVAAAVDRPELRVRDWREMNKNLFSALKLERIATFLISSIEIIVASFLHRLHAPPHDDGEVERDRHPQSAWRDRRNHSPHLHDRGCHHRRHRNGARRVHRRCHVQRSRLVGLRLDPDVYYIDRLPINVSAWDYAAVTLAALTICTIAHHLPGKAGGAAAPSGWPALRVSAWSAGRAPTDCGIRRERPVLRTRSTVASPLVVATHVQKSFRHMGRTLEVLRGVDLEIHDGEMLGIVGPSGAGKSTLLHCIGTLDVPTRGSIRLAGEEITAMPGWRLAELRNRTIGFVFQFHHLLPEFNALENVMMPGLVQGLPRRELETRAGRPARRGGAARANAAPSGGALRGGAAARGAGARVDAGAEAASGRRADGEPRLGDELAESTICSLPSTSSGGPRSWW